MNIYQNQPEQVESFVKSQSYFLESRLKEKLSPDRFIESISRNPNQYGRKSIYNLNLSDNTTIVLKLNSKGSAENEVKGMNYANSSSIPSPKLIDFYLDSTNPLKNNFLLMDYIDIIPFEEFYQGDEIVHMFGKNYKININEIKSHIKEASELCLKLHQKSGDKNSTYTTNKMKQLFNGFKEKIGDNASLEKELTTLFKYYEENKTDFNNSPEYHLHGDLDPSNLPHTKNGIVLIDWENYHKGDCAEDIAYFALRNFLIPKDFNEQIEKISDQYSKKDSSFNKRLKFHLHLSDIWHQIEKKTPKILSKSLLY
jgi:fructosamine-3-kinase